MNKTARTVDRQTLQTAHFPFFKLNFVRVLLNKQVSEKSFVLKSKRVLCVHYLLV